ncbi:MAG: aminodeoxychorismate synthase component I [Pseudomonadota bacterium]|nr:aminodeoxychorismate synthase component I [Pseudomonadota bacterium]
MAAEPFLLFDDARAQGAGKARLYQRPVGTVAAHRREEVRPALEELRRQLAAGRHLAGFLSYEAGFALDPALADHGHDSGGPLLWFGLFDGFDEIAPDEVEQWLPVPHGAQVGPPRPRIARDAYVDAAGQVREHLFAGDFYQANLTFGCDVTLLGDPLAAYARVRGEGRGGWGGAVRFPGGWLLSFSPEQFFTIRAGTVEARPMKGTAARGADAAADAVAIAALRADPKQRAENLMIVDLLRNDLARIAETGSVDVPELFAVETFPTLHQMISRVTARLSEGLTAIDVIETIFPCGSITGAPKISAMQHLARLEPEPRGAYTGSMGWIDPGGDAAFNVMIRTLELADGAPVARLGLGSGLVVDSIAADEWDECLLKGEYVNRAAALPDLIETMRFDPDEGIVALDRHLERLRSSAEAFGFSFDRHAARNELQAATFGKKYMMIARLLLSPSGAIAIESKRLEPPEEHPVPVAVRPLPVDPSDPRLRFKTTDRRFYDDARLESGAFEVVFTDAQGLLTEGSFTNIFVERDGKLLTPAIERGILPGVLRATLLDEGRAIEGDLTPADLEGDFYVGNMARGLLAARLA